ncbi:MAG: SGNH/GDSL hydrolase family protein [Alphaproteobacteria bacterium]|nr:MAG: SGNH/GDSL hydrolase family protein [Alphaproteobacteria bacterium]
MSRSRYSAAGAAFRFALVLSVFCPAAAVTAYAQDALPCAAPAEATALEHVPVRFRERIAQGLPIKIVAIGSSSTFGAGATSPAASYPSRLEAELKAQLPGLPITVLNKGVGGEEAAQMVARFDADVIDENPDLVLWQVGSNSVLRDHPTPGEVIRQGVERLKQSGAEVILINPQYAPKIIVKPDIGHAVDVITATARDEEVGVFNRFAVMRHWREAERIPYEQFLSPDLLHMNDWSYGCTARLLASAILDGVKLPAATAKISTLK